MSKAFTKDEGANDAAIVVPSRAPLPAGVPNYITASGLAKLRDELRELEAERASRTGPEAAAIAARIAELEARVATAERVDVTHQPRDEVRFGATVEVLGESGAARRYRIVGVDEADATHGLIAFVAPLARALLGKRVGDVATVRTPAGDEELEVIAIEYAP